MAEPLGEPLTPISDVSQARIAPWPAHTRSYRCGGVYSHHRAHSALSRAPFTPPQVTVHTSSSRLRALLLFGRLYDTLTRRKPPLRPPTVWANPTSGLATNSNVGCLACQKNADPLFHLFPLGQPTAIPGHVGAGFQLMGFVARASPSHLQIQMGSRTSA